jgi:hypothetical protein
MSILYTWLKVTPFSVAGVPASPSAQQSREVAVMRRTTSKHIAFHRSLVIMAGGEGTHTHRKTDRRTDGHGK